MEIIIKRHFTVVEAKYRNNLLFNFISRKSRNPLLYIVCSLSILVLIPGIIYAKHYENIQYVGSLILITCIFSYQYFKLKKEFKERLKKEIENVPENTLITITINDKILYIKDFESEYSIKWSSLKYYYTIGTYALLFPCDYQRPLLVINVKDIEKEDLLFFKNLLESKLKRKK